MPLLPLVIYQGLRIKSTIPKLPEAKGDFGVIGNGDTNSLQIIAIGESSIAGVGVEESKDGLIASMAKTIAEQLDITTSWKIYARSGYTVKVVRDKLVSSITESKSEADLIVLGIGGNDTFRLNRSRNWRKQVQQLIEDINDKFADTPVVFINMPPIKEMPAFTKPIKYVLNNLMEKFSFELSNAIQKFDHVYYYSRVLSIDDWKQRLNIYNQRAEFFSDGVHPSTLTYQIWGQDIAQFVLDQPKLVNQLKLKINNSSDVQPVN